MRWDAGPLGLETGWRSILLDRAETEPLHDGRFGVDLRNQDETMGIRMDLSEKIHEELVTPELDLSAYIDVTESVRISTDLRDILAPLIDDGRPRIGDGLNDDFPFVTPGFRFVLKTQVSL